MSSTMYNSTLPDRQSDYCRESLYEALEKLGQRFDLQGGNGRLSTQTPRAVEPAAEPDPYMAAMLRRATWLA